MAHNKSATARFLSKPADALSIEVLGCGNWCQYTNSV